MQHGSITVSQSDRLLSIWNDMSPIQSQQQQNVFYSIWNENTVYKKNDAIYV